MAKRLLELRLKTLPKLPKPTTNRISQSNNKHKYSFRFKSDTMQKIDFLVRKGFFKNRSHFIRESIKLMFFKISLLAEINPELNLNLLFKEEI
jgi:hypothetical protein